MKWPFPVLFAAPDALFGEMLFTSGSADENDWCSLSTISHLKDKIFLRATMNRVFDDGGQEFSGRFFRLSLPGKWNVTREALIEWRDAGFIEIACDPEQADEAVVCVKMLKRIC